MKHYDYPNCREAIEDRCATAFAKGALSVMIFAIVALLLASAASADDYQCMDDDGCLAIQSTETGTVEWEFKKGEIASTSQGFIFDTDDGWVRYDTKAIPVWPSGVGVDWSREISWGGDVVCLSAMCLVESPWGDAVPIDANSRCSVLGWYTMTWGEFEAL